MLIIKTSLSWDKVKGICVIADEHIVKGTQVSQFHPDWDKVYRRDYIEMLPDYQSTLVNKLCYEYRFGRDELYIFPWGNEGYMNHSFTPTVDEIGLAYDTIPTGTELTCDYTLLDSRCVKGSEPWLS